MFQDVLKPDSLGGVANGTGQAVVVAMRASGAVRVDVGRSRGEVAGGRGAAFKTETDAR